MVIWLFAGGGPSEIQGLVPFLRRNFQNHSFERRLPITRKKGPKPGRPSFLACGGTGRNLSKQIKHQLRNALKYGHCDCILVIDDLDCRDARKRSEAFDDAINSVQGAENVARFIGFAAPEIEAWLIADWNNTFASHPDFRGFHEKLRYVLSRTYRVPFEEPETFSEYDHEKDACKDKLSEAIISATEFVDAESPDGCAVYKKGTHTPEMLNQANASNVSEKCKLFSEMYNFLTS